MKQLRKTLILLLAFFTTSVFAQDYTVASDKDLSAPFDTYKTYAWANQVRSAKNLAYVINDAILNTRIKNAVAHELAARNYSMNEQEPDILVNYRVFDEPVEMTGYEGYFHDTDFWGTEEVKNAAPTMLPRSNLVVNNDTPALDKGTEYYFDKGTLMVQLVDADKGVVVWQGYASGLTDGMVFDKDEEHIAQAVNLIFDRYDFVLSNH
ncbi:MAG: DUF4136 domain-containing protein [Bacteroidetes bacterium]|nr:DUF4136 domain-containing protein [Bacteroidota bacterium]